MSDGLWLDEETPTTPGPRRRRLVAGAVAATCLVVAAVPIAIIASGGSVSHTGAPAPSAHGAVVKGNSAPTVLRALTASTAAGSFDVAYTFGGSTPGTTTTTTTTKPAPCVSTISPTITPTTVSVGMLGGTVSGSAAATIPPKCTSATTPGTQPLGGNATVDIQPFAMVATSQVSGFGTIVLRDNGTDIWEEGGGNYGLSPGSSASGPGSPLTGFAQLVEDTLGQRQGALAMLGLASPTGYLNLAPAETASANLVGSGAVDGVPVEVYSITQPPGEVTQVPGQTAQEAQAVTDAMVVLKQQGFTGSTVLVSVDAAGFIRQTQTTEHFSDGTSMKTEAVFSNFGCAGTVLMPGQVGPALPPVGCVSPDNPSAPPATTVPTSSPSTTSVPSTTVPPTTVPSTTSTTRPQAPTTSTTSTTAVPGSTTTRPTPQSGTGGTGATGSG